MSKVRLRKRDDGGYEVQRFGRFRLWEHGLAVITFAALVLTGFPQKFYSADWAAWLVKMMGGLDTTRSIHRIFGLVFCFHAVVHLGAIAAGLLRKTMEWSLLPIPQDLRDAWHNLRYYLGYEKAPPHLPKFDYRQKFEYMGLVLGGAVMIFSGLVLLFPVTTAQLLPGQLIPVARVAHSNEAMLAFLVLLVWHIYGGNLAPEHFPLDRTILTGYMPVEELKHHHRREYDRLFPDGPPAEEVDEKGPTVDP